MTDELIIVRYGEISLKSKYVRKKFESILIKNIKKALERKNISCEIEKERGRIYIYTNKINSSISILKKIFGIVSFSTCIKTKVSLDNISKKVIDFSKDYLNKEVSFAIRSTRSGNHIFSSQDVSIKVGNDIVEKFGLKVDLTNPDYEIFIEVRGTNAYIYDKKIKGPGGMPFGSQDKLLSIINDDFSLLSSWYLLSRGCKVLFFVNNDYNLDFLESFCNDWYIPKDFEIYDKKQDFFYEINRISNEKKCKAVVSSIYNLENEGVLNIKEYKKNIQKTVLYPLISFNKEEIKEILSKKGLLK